jgi:hypothetical protein
MVWIFDLLRVLYQIFLNSLLETLHYFLSCLLRKKVTVYLIPEIKLMVYKDEVNLCEY